jgi:two-component system NarL family sensor kinase
MSFVAPVAQWGWVLGAGLYMDDIEATLNIIDSHARQNIEETRRNFYGIAAAAVLAIGLAGLAFNLSGQRVASGKLQRLAQRVVRSQEDERVRVARELHDGVVQVMVSSKFLLETAQASLPQAAAVAEGRRGARQLLDQGLQRLNDALAEIRRVSHGLRPALLDDLGLAAALALLVEQIRAQCPYRVDFVQQGQVRDLPTAHATALFRVAQEAFNNIQAHARPTAVQVVLRFGARTVSLRIIDDGQGFDLQRVQADARGGIGLRNMRERMESLQGRFEMQSGRQGTRLVVTLPLPAAAGGA